MATSRWVYRLADGVFLRGGFYEPTFDPTTEGVVEFPDADPHPDPTLDRYDPILGKRRATEDELAQAKRENYRVEREQAYPSVGDQLDALWHAMDDGVIPKVPAFYDTVAAVKAKYPKPQ